MRLSWRIRKIVTGSNARRITISDANSDAVRHVFRALLRQCTYLPDPAARQYMHHHIVSRFRDYYPQSTLKRRQKPAALLKQRLPTMLREARKGLVCLHRANHGHIRHLGKVLSMTYGRIGKRRHQLLKDLKIPDIPIDQAAVEKLSQPANQDVPHPSERLMVLVKSQAKRLLSRFSRSNHPHPKLEIPEKNSWGRPMPIKRVRNLKRRWYAETLDRIMPPLPEAEWTRLLMRASGQSPWEGPVPRRKWAGTPQNEEQSDIGRERVKGNTSGHLSNPHKITPRYMRKIWAGISEQCPLMRPSATNEFEWEVVWGDVKRHGVTQFVLDYRDRYGDDMFEGVDEKGKVFAKP